MKKYYREQRNQLIKLIQGASFASRVEILAQDAGLHFLLKVDTNRTDSELKTLCARAGIHVRCLTDYTIRQQAAFSHCLVVNYTGFDSTTAPQVLARLEEILQTL